MRHINQHRRTTGARNYQESMEIVVMGNDIYGYFKDDNTGLLGYNNLISIIMHRKDGIAQFCVDTNTDRLYRIFYHGEESEDEQKERAIKFLMKCMDVQIQRGLYKYEIEKGETDD